MSWTSVLHCERTSLQWRILGARGKLRLATTATELHPLTAFPRPFSIHIGLLLWIQTESLQCLHSMVLGKPQSMY